MLNTPVTLRETQRFMLSCNAANFFIIRSMLSITAHTVDAHNMLITSVQDQPRYLDIPLSI